MADKFLNTRIMGGRLSGLGGGHEYESLTNCKKNSCTRIRSYI